jgi:hypothetical protein
MARATDEGIYKITSLMVPIRWTAPECFKHRFYDSYCDVWSFGVLLWELFSYATVPYTTMTNEQVAEAVMKGYRLPSPDQCPPEVYTLMRQCWNETSIQRPNFTVIFQKLHTIWMKYPIQYYCVITPKIS